MRKVNSSAIKFPITTSKKPCYSEPPEMVGTPPHSIGYAITKDPHSLVISRSYTEGAHAATPRNLGTKISSGFQTVKPFSWTSRTWKHTQQWALTPHFILQHLAGLHLASRILGGRYSDHIWAQWKTQAIAILTLPLSTCLRTLMEIAYFLGSRIIRNTVWLRLRSGRSSVSE